MSESGDSRSRSDPLDVSSVLTVDDLGYEDRRRKHEELRNARISNDDEHEREFRRLMRNDPDIASQHNLQPLKMECVGLRASATLMAEASNNYGNVSQRILKTKLKHWRN